MSQARIWSGSVDNVISGSSTPFGIYDTDTLLINQMDRKLLLGVLKD